MLIFIRGTVFLKRQPQFSARLALWVPAVSDAVALPHFVQFGISRGWGMQGGGGVRARGRTECSPCCKERCWRTYDSHSFNWWEVWGRFKITHPFGI